MRRSVVDLIARNPADRSARARSGAYAWKAFAAERDSFGCAVLPNLLAPKECGGMRHPVGIIVHDAR